LWHADLYHWRHLDAEEEHWLKISLALCPQLSLATESLVHLLAREKRFNDATAVVHQAEAADPRSSDYAPLLDWLKGGVVLGKQEKNLRAAVAKSPADHALNLQLARLLQDEGNYSEVNERLRLAGALPGWSHEEIGDVMHYFIDVVHNPDAAIAFLEARTQVEPDPGELLYSLAALHATLNHKSEALRYLAQSIALGGANAVNSAGMDPRFATLQNDPRFEALLSSASIKDAPATNGPTPKPPKR
jgi:hypothetical protein